jgi:hypothetical protein
MYRNSILLICFVLVLSLATSVTEGADPTLVGWWKFDEDTGVIANDMSTYGNNGTLQGDPQWVIGHLVGALRFDGVGDYVEVPHASILTVDNEVTVMAWINAQRHNSAGGDWQAILAKSNNPRSYSFYTYTSGTLHFSTTSGGAYVGSTSSGQVPLNAWVHVCAMVSGGQHVYYINGQPAGTFQSGINLPGTADTATVRIGTTHENNNNNFLGMIDDARIYNRALTQAEVREAMLGGDVREARRPDPAHLAVGVPIDANLGWLRGDGAVQEEVYFGTDPCALPKVTDIMVLPPFPPLYDPPGDLIASTTYYWQVVEVNGVDRFESSVWEFTTVRGEAQPDYPFDGAIIPGDEITYLGNDYIWTKLIFIPGATSVEYTGYFNEDYSKVEGRHPDANLGSPPYASIPGWEYTFFAGNPQVPPADYTLVRGTRYYWTVDSKDALGNTFAGDIWEFGIQGFKAFAPSPPNEAIFVSTTPFLSWLPGFVVEDHDVYIGTSWEDVNNARYDPVNPPPEFLVTRVDPNYQIVSPLPTQTKMYWRVDEVVGRMPPPIGGGNYVYGDVWEFTTVPEGVGQIREDLWWNLTTDQSANRNSLSWLYTHPNFPGQPDETNMLDSFDSGMDIGNDYGGMIHGWLHPAYSGDYKFWLATDDYSELYLSTDENPANMQLIASQPDFWVADYIWYNNPLQESASIPLVAGQKYYIRACWKEGGGGDQCQVAWQGPDQPLAPVEGSASAVIPGTRLEPFVQLWAHDPDPRDWAYAVPVSTTLKWGPGDHAALHDVYLGTDKSAVKSATTTTPGIYLGRIGPNSLGPMAFDSAKFYYWRIDEVNLAGPDPCLWKGTTWTFRTVGAAGGLLGLYYHWDGILPPGLPGGPPDPGPANPFQVFVMSRIDPSVNFNWGTGSPDPNINVDNFSCKWVGHVECPIDANYTFLTETDDGSRVFIDGVQILPIAAWQQQGMTWWSGEVLLTAGLHDIEMHHEEGGGGAGARLAWSAIPTNPSDDPIAQQIIPPIWLWPPLFASGPRPPDGSTIDERKPALEWIPGVNADYHEVYFSANFDDVNNRNPGIKQITTDPCHPYPAVPPLELARTYYWLVDEVKTSPPGRWDARTVWSFTISECLSLDNMEDYNDHGEMRQVRCDKYGETVMLTWFGEVHIPICA